MLQLFIEILSPFAALVTGTFAYRSMNSFFRLLYWQLITWIVCYLAGYAVTMWQASQGKPADNQWIMNMHILLESGLLIMAARVAFPWNTLKKLALGAYGLFLVVFIYLWSRRGISVYLHYADVTACILITLFYLGLLFRFNRYRPLTGNYFSEKLVCTGILLYFACSVPYVVCMDYLRRHDPGLNKVLYHVINDLLANMRYVTLAVAFWRIGRTSISQSYKP
jgi:hypothetical protein